MLPRLAKILAPQTNAEVIAENIEQMSGDNHHSRLVEQALAL